ncbi:MAG: homoserine dehydrogenase [Acidobacteriota bacterium]
MRHIPIILLGYGNVGRAFVRLVEEKRDRLNQDYGLNLVWTTIFRREGRYDFPPIGESDHPVIEKDGLKFGELKTGRVLNDLKSLLREAPGGVMVDGSVSDQKTGQPGYDYWKKAFSWGWHVVTANKGPLVYDYKGLHNSAHQNRCGLGISGATAAALPTVDLALYALAGADIQSIEGILNGTSNYILTRMGEGVDYAEALSEAQGKGIAEPDPAMDVEGWDTAYKILLITNASTELKYVLDDVSVEGISSISRQEVEKAAREGKRIKLLGRFERTDTGGILEVAPRAVGPDHPLFWVNGTEKGITFETDTMGSISAVGGRSSPVGAAAALLKDLINILRQHDNKSD